MNKIIKRSLQGIVAAAIISGTYFGRHGDLPPFYSHKTADSYGINVAVYTKIDSGASVNGLNVSFITDNYGTINGANVSIDSDTKGNFNGANIDLVAKNNGKITGANISPFIVSYHNSMLIGANISLVHGNYGKLTGANVSILNLGLEGSKVKGLELGIANCPENAGEGSDLHGFALGIINYHTKLNGVQVGIYNQSNDSKGMLLNFDSDKK